MKKAKYTNEKNERQKKRETNSMPKCEQGASGL